MAFMPIEIARFLNAHGVGVFDEAQGSGNIFIGIMPDGIGVPDDLILLNQYGGRQSVVSDLGGAKRPGLQVKCRAKYLEDAANKAEQINDLLNEYRGLVDGAWYNWIRQVQAPMFLEQDTNERIIFVQNFYIDKQGGQ